MPQEHRDRRERLAWQIQRVENRTKDLKARLAVLAAAESTTG